MIHSKTTALVAIAVLLSACSTTMQTRSSATASGSNVPASSAYQMATRAALDAGFTILSANKDAGLITATRGANAMLTWQNPIINISISELGGGSEVMVASTVGGQMRDWGVTKKTVEDFCAALQRQSTKLRCQFSE